MNIYLRLFTAFLLVAPLSCNADWYYDFIRITCIPEARYLQFEAKSIEGSYVLLETQFDDNLRKQRLAAWVKKGYYDPSRLEFECRLPESTYKIKTTKSSFESSITFSLYRNETLIVENITLGGDSSGGTSVQSVEISDGLQGWDTRQMMLCFGQGWKSCRLLTDSNFPKSAPIDKAKLNSFLAPKADTQLQKK